MILQLSDARDWEVILQKQASKFEE